MKKILVLLAVASTLSLPALARPQRTFAGGTGGATRYIPPRGPLPVAGKPQFTDYDASRHQEVPHVEPKSGRWIGHDSRTGLSAPLYR